MCFIGLLIFKIYYLCVQESPVQSGAGMIIEVMVLTYMLFSCAWWKGPAFITELNRIGFPYSSTAIVLANKLVGSLLWEVCHF